MASPRVIRAALRAAPYAVLAALVTWSASDFLAIDHRGLASALLAAVAFGVLLLVLAAVLRRTWMRTIGLVSLGAPYIAAHAVLLGVQVVPSLVFLAVLICHVELRVLAERFAPLYDASLRSAERRLIGGALGRAILRLTVAGVLAIVMPILAADLAVAGVVPLTTIPTAILLAAALIAVVALLALMPSLSRRTA